MLEARRTTVAAFGVFGILLASYSYWLPARDWNSASRLMLTYALGDRGTVCIDGLEDQTGDKAYFRGHFYSDKGPGYSLLALPPYLLLRKVGCSEHPVHRPGFPWWWADYVVTLATSGLATALGGAYLTVVSARLGCGPARSVLVGLSYGLATPAYVYATLAYGHQATALFLLVSFSLVWGEDRPRSPIRSGTAAGFLASYAAINELAVGPIAAILGLSLIARVLRGRWPFAAAVAFGVGAMIPAAVLLGYNAMAFGSPLDMGYAHHAVPRFRAVHHAGNPLGLIAPRWDRLPDLLWSRYRGLLFYAPILVLAPVGYVAMGMRGRWAQALVASVISATMLLVNLCYPEWTGGWSTGPRLLVPAIPFLMIGVAGALAIPGRTVTAIGVTLALVGFLIVSLFQGVGGRLPDSLGDRPLDDPLSQVVLPHWLGESIEPWWPGGRFGDNLAIRFAPGLADAGVTPPRWQWIQFLPLILAQVVMGGLLAWGVARSPTEVPSKGVGPAVSGVRPPSPLSGPR